MLSTSTASVIIPVYNGERFVAEAIRCALEQTCVPLQVIVIDDASNDRTGEIVTGKFAHELAHGRLHYECNVQNRERSYSRNRGAEIATGNYLFFLDHDDLWDKNYIVTVLNLFEHTRCDVVYSFPRTFINEAGSVIRHSAKRISTDSAELVFASRVGYPSATAFRRSAFPGYKEDCILREDWEIFLRGYLADQRISILDSNLVKMRGHGGRTSKSVKFWRSTLRVYEQYQAQIPQRYRCLFLYHIADICLRYGDLPRGWRLSMQALMGGALPDLRMVHRLLTRGMRLDRYFLLAAERRKLAEESMP